jgi:hypothetical protein
MGNYLISGHKWLQNIDYANTVYSKIEKIIQPTITQQSLFATSLQIICCLFIPRLMALDCAFKSSQELMFQKQNQPIV